MSETPKNPSRRDFFKYAFGATALLATAGLEAAEKKQVPSPADVYNILLKYVDKKQPSENAGIDLYENDKDPETMLARMMMSEEIRDFRKFCHHDVLIAWTVLNRVGGDWQKMSKEQLAGRMLYELTNDNDFGPQISRPYATNFDPKTPRKHGARWRVLAAAILAGEFNHYNYGQTHFFHPQTQDSDFSNGKVKKNAATITQERLNSGLKEIVIPGIDNNYIKFFGPK